MFKYLLKKEFTLILRDIHALLVLFIMPTLFILIMSLALKNSYSNTIDVKLKVAILSNKNSSSIKTLIKDINKNSFFKATYINTNDDNKSLLYKKNFDFLINIESNYILKVKSAKQDFKIHLYSKPDTQQQKISLIKSIIVSSIKTTVLKQLLKVQKIESKSMNDLNSFIQNNIVYKNKKIDLKPTSVQQSVPAWLVFSMFFILIPISNTFINEKNFGTINRIRSINVSFLPILISKIFPYYIINQIQVIFMILVGIYIVPMLGGDKLVILGNYLMIFIVSSVVSLTSISFALLIANISKTTEEATTYGGVSNIILAALGGIMVPKFVMPLFMQEATEYSPMAWGLQSFLEVFVRGGNFNDISTYIYKMIIFAIICLLIAYFLLKKRS
ncbi:ABC transporter permease [Arcobacter sp. CECT 8985]|uniref:ABC transporter permease n=1 Tax=Arcobacter sp. CECT 8985 TaxID=1935424 RepID=UPI00100AC175|nr:ABC transporter permease [Arcobacter sp. CECT 8985]RXJ85599.1 ABC transporter [Arcobacter sp. CECT 8985]